MRIAKPEPVGGILFSRESAKKIFSGMVGYLRILSRSISKNSAHQTAKFSSLDEQASFKSIRGLIWNILQTSPLLIYDSFPKIFTSASSRGSSAINALSMF